MEQEVLDEWNECDVYANIPGVKMIPYINYGGTWM
jgi:hypothetical protein